jgi:hypothetical protein
MAQSDNCVFYKSNCVICVYVDDFLVAAASSHEIDQVQRALEKEFRLNDLGTPRSFLGIQLDYHAGGAVSSLTPVYPKGSLRLWHGNLSDEIYPYESQASLESPFRRRTSGRGNKSTICYRHRFIDVSDGRNAAGYCVCAGHFESLQVSATIAPPGRPAAITSLCQSHAMPSHYIPQWPVDRIHRYRLRWLRRH